MESHIHKTNGADDFPNKVWVDWPHSPETQRHLERGTRLEPALFVNMIATRMFFLQFTFEPFEYPSDSVLTKILIIITYYNLLAYCSNQSIKLKLHF